MKIRIRVVDTKVGELGVKEFTEGENGKVASTLLNDIVRQSAAMGAKEVDILIVLDRNNKEEV